MRFLRYALVAVLAADVMAAGTVDLSDPDLRAGRKLYNVKCARCHKFYDPAKYSDSEWRDWMQKMSRKAKLKPDQHELLSRYLDTFREGTNSGERPK